MPPSKKNIKEKETENKSVKKEVKEVKKEKEVKGKKEVKNKSEEKKWAEVTDDEYHDENDTDNNSEEKSEKSVSDISGDDDLDEEILIGTLKAISTNLVKNKSIVDFDYDEINMMDMEELSDYDTNTLLKVLMVRGTKNNNPILWSKTRTLLKLLNFELKPNQPFRNNNNNRRNFNNNDRRDNRQDNRRDNRREDNYYQKKLFENKNGPIVNDKEEENEIVHDKKKTWRGGKK